MFYVYLLKSKVKKDQLYVGYSTDLKKRFDSHNKKLVPSTKPYAPWELIFYEAYKDKADAKRREEYFKTSPGKKALRIMLRNSLF